MRQRPFEAVDEASPAVEVMRRCLQRVPPRSTPIEESGVCLERSWNALGVLVVLGQREEVPRFFHARGADVGMLGKVPEQRRRPSLADSCQEEVREPIGGRSRSYSSSYGRAFR